MTKIPVPMRAARLLAATLTLLVAVAAAPHASAQDPAPVAAGQTPPQVQELLRLLDDPAVRGWLERRREGTASAPVAAAGPRPTPSGYMVSRVSAIRQHLDALGAAVPMLPAEIKRAGLLLMLELQESGLLHVALLVAVFLALGLGTDWLYRWATAGVKRWIVGLQLETVNDRLRAILVRLAFGTGMVAAFAVGSVGAFLAFEWPPLLHEIVLGYLMVFLVLRLTIVVSRFLLAPGGERFRIVPMSTPAAWFWYWRHVAVVGWFAFGWVTLGLLRTLGVAPEARQLVAYTLGLGLLAIGLEIAWRRPRRERGEEDTASPRRRSSRASAWLLSGYFILLWGLWVLSAMPTFWLAVVVVALPVAIDVTQRSVKHLLRPPGAADAHAEVESVFVVCLERGARAALIIGAALLLAQAWQIDLVEMAARDTFSTRLLRGALNAVVIVLLADLAWHVMTTVLDRKLADAQDSGPADTDEARRQARTRTLLPILRNVLFVVLIVMTALMVLSAMGVEIGPLIAGAGVVGLAVGFGAQTLVKDIFSGVFYLLDDAFRVGEYIQSGSYKGTVEGFSLRSVKLRHHRGPLYTVPFGELGAIENMSRDWVIDKLMVSVTYDTPLDKVKKLIKQIGKELAQEPDFAPHIIESLKMQGVEQFGDFAIQIRMKMMTKPGEQFVIRRRAYALIKKAFEENGIKFAFPTVQVAGGGDAAPAAAQQALELVKPPKAV